MYFVCIRSMDCGRHRDMELLEMIPKRWFFLKKYFLHNCIAKRPSSSCHVEFYRIWQYAVKVRRHTPWSRVRCHGCRFSHSQFHSQIHSRRHSLRITLKYTTLVRMRSSNDHENIQWSEWRLGFNSVYWMKNPLRVVLGLWIHTDERMIELEHHTSKQSFTLWNILL